jgi:hypothetical protein
LIPVSLPVIVIVTVLPLQIVAVTGETPGLVNGNALIVTLTAAEAAELQLAVV